MPVVVGALNVLQGPGVQIQDVGQVYDLLLATRDGSTLPCKNKDGQVVNVAKLAFMTTIDRNQVQHEETELQHKDQLVQLAGPNLIDREFDQWPQVSQGDWSGGVGQRVFTGATPITGGTESDPTRYWDGLGILWPIDDYLPQIGTLPPADEAEGGALMRLAGNGVVAGQVFNSGVTTAMVIGFAYMQNVAPNHNIFAMQFSNGVIAKLNPIPGSTNGTPFLSCDYTIGQGTLFFAYDSGGNVIQVATITSDNPPVVTNIFTIPNALLNDGFSLGRIAAGAVAGHTYVAVRYRSTNSPFEQLLQVFDLTPGLTGGNASAPVPVGPSGQRMSALQIDFLGDNIVIGSASGQTTLGNADNSWSGGSEATIFQFNISTNTLTTLANFPGYNNVWFCPVAGSLFVLATWESASLGFPNLTDMYLLQGGSLQFVGPVRVQATNTAQSNSISGVCEPQVLGSYAIFPVYYFSAAGGGTRISVFAYDVLRGRLFKINDFGPYDQSLGNDHGRRFGIYSGMTRLFGSSNVTVQRGVTVPVLSATNGTQNIANAQEMMIGISNGAFSPFLQQGVQIVSSLIDFTSAQLKLFRQVVVTWAQPGLPTDSGIKVTVDVWLDQDPANLAAVPDFTATVSGGISTQGQTQLKLTVNKIAHKLVYRVTTTGPSPALTSAVKLQTVVIRAATGWTRTMMLDLADNSVVNTKNGLCWDKQSTPGKPAVDATVAYNFLRQLWRLEGGECVAVFPNGDPPANWLLQDIHWDSPKPFGVSFRGDQKSSLGYIATLKLREDV